jgi:hypothetical protein
MITRTPEIHHLHSGSGTREVQDGEDRRPEDALQREDDPGYRVGDSVSGKPQIIVEDPDQIKIMDKK